MTTTAITPLRQRMVEDMNARKLGAGTQRGHIRAPAGRAGSRRRKSCRWRRGDSVRWFPISRDPGAPGSF
jgi:hypothetical protein